MVSFSPRFFVLPVIALAVIFSLPRATEKICLPQTAAAAAASAIMTQTSCAAEPKHLVMAPSTTLTR